MLETWLGWVGFGWSFCLIWLRWVVDLVEFLDLAGMG